MGCVVLYAPHEGSDRHGKRIMAKWMLPNKNALKPLDRNSPTILKCLTNGLDNGRNEKVSKCKTTAALDFDEMTSFSIINYCK